MKLTSNVKRFHRVFHRGFQGLIGGPTRVGLTSDEIVAHAFRQRQSGLQVTCVVFFGLVDQTRLAAGRLGLAAGRRNRRLRIGRRRLAACKRLGLAADRRNRRLRIGRRRLAVNLS
jgi:hypothetical protein